MCSLIPPNQSEGLNVLQKRLYEKKKSRTKFEKRRTIFLFQLVTKPGKLSTPIKFDTARQPSSPASFIEKKKKKTTRYKIFQPPLKRVGGISSFSANFIHDPRG